MARRGPSDIAADTDHKHDRTGHKSSQHFKYYTVIEARQTELTDVLAVIQQAVAMDGGSVSLVAADYTTGSVRVMLTGACGACALVGATAEQGVERVLKQRLDWVADVVVTADDSDVTHSRSLGRGGFKPL